MISRSFVWMAVPWLAACDVSLDISTRAQETDFWDWVAVSQMAFEATTGRTAPAQCQLANTFLARTDCCLQPSLCALPGAPRILELGLASQPPRNTPPTFDALKSELRARRPVIFSWTFDGGGEHWMVALGYATEVPELEGEPLVAVWDPAPTGSGEHRIVTFSALLGGLGYTHGKSILGVREEMQ